MAEEERKLNALEAYQLGQVLSSVSWIVSGGYLFLNEIAADQLLTAPDHMRLLGPGLLFLLTSPPGWYVEAIALREKGYCVNPISNTVYAKTDNIALSIAAGSLYGWASNPMNLNMLRKLTIGNEKDVAAAAHLSAVFCMGIVYTAVNGAIVAGKTDKVVEIVKKVNKYTIDPVMEFAERHFQVSQKVAWLNEKILTPVKNIPENTRNYLISNIQIYETETPIISIKGNS